MAEAFIGEIRAFPYTFTPYGWLTCDGTQYSANQYTALFALLGGVFPGTQQNTFKVPDLRGFACLGVGTSERGSYTLGSTVGQANVTLTENQMPSHDHNLQLQAGSSRLAAPSPSGLPLAPVYIQPGTNRSFNLPMYVSATTSPTTTAMSAASVSVAGGNGPHTNLSPLQIMRFCICWDGYFPNFD
ncbi:MAG: hypothetical protein RLY86_649 [Pseudomonadota bacterium]|jgi:microcystin-dependent protein